MDLTHDLDIAVIVPCFDEEAAVGKVVTDLRRALPGARIYVYDNGSGDRTREVAAAAGAVVRSEPRRGKGNVVRRAFADVEADVYLMIDGDDTYDASVAPMLVRTLVDGNYDQVIAARDDADAAAHRAGHAAGNRFLNRIVAATFGSRVRDMLSGYRVFSRRFVKSFPAVSEQFEIETELTIHALHLRLPMTEVVAPFGERPAGGESKLRTVRDGVRILWWILRFLRYERPVATHGVVAALLSGTAVVLMIPIVIEYVETGLVPRFPTAILATGLALMAGGALMLGLILSAIKRAREEVARLTYLEFGPVVPRPGPTDRRG